MEFHECSDRAAAAAQKEFPSFRITGKTVSDVLRIKPVSVLRSPLEDCLMPLALQLLCALMLGFAVYHAATPLLDALMEWSLRRHHESLHDFESVRKALL